MEDISNLSEEAQELIRLCGSERGAVGDVSAVITEHPELLKGLNEYVAHVKRVGEFIAETKETPIVGHKTSEVIRKISKPEPRT